MRDVLVAVGTIVLEDTGADVSTGICTSAHVHRYYIENQEIRTGNTLTM